jgi:ribosomal protein S18 acetylase RimI-like enzyme
MSLSPGRDPASAQLSSFEPKGPRVDPSIPSSASALDLQLQQYVRGVAMRDRDVERIGPFTATFDTHSTIKYLSYAIPDVGAQPTLEDVAALAAAYVARDRLPRLEYLPAVAPAVEAALVAGGFAVEARLPVMTCAPGAAPALAPPDGVVVEVPQTEADFAGMWTAQHAAFGAPDEQPAPGELDRARRRLAAGGLVLLARDTATGAVVGGGVATVPGDGVTEIAGIGVLERHRRRGIAGAITAGLARAAFAAGTTVVWLTPGNDGAHRVYERAGFVDTSIMVHISKPAG